MAERKRKTTMVGIGVGPTGSFRTSDTNPAPAPGDTPAAPVTTGVRRKVTIELSTEELRSRAAADAPSDTNKGGARQKRPDALHVGEVTAPRTTLRGLVERTPRVIDAASIVRAPLDTRHAFVLQLVDGKTSMTDLVDASGFPEEEVEAIVARLERLGIVAL